MNNTESYSILQRRVHQDKMLALINSNSSLWFYMFVVYHKAMDSMLLAYSNKLHTCSSIAHFRTQRGTDSPYCSNRVKQFCKSALSSSLLDKHNCSLNMCSQLPSNKMDKTQSGDSSMMSPDSTIYCWTYNKLTIRSWETEDINMTQSSNHTLCYDSTAMNNRLASYSVGEGQGICSPKHRKLAGYCRTSCLPTPMESICSGYCSCSNNQVSSKLDHFLCNTTL